MDSSFGAPVYAEEAAQSVGTGSQDAEKPQKFVDPDDPALTSEILTVDTEKDAYEFPPPPPDGKYRAKIKILQSERDGQKMDYFSDEWGDNKVKVFVTAIEATIQDPSGKYDGVKVYERNVSTFLQRNATKVTSILRLLKQPSGAPWIPPNPQFTPKQWMELLVKALSGEPEIGIETIWEWNCQGCGEAAKKAGEKYPKSIQGMNKFPQVKGAFVPEMPCAANRAHAYSRARAVVSRFLALSELR